MRQAITMIVNFFVYCVQILRGKTSATAVGRRRLLNAQNSSSPPRISTKVQVLSEYVETSQGYMLYSRLYTPSNPHDAKAMMCHCVGFSGCVDMNHDKALKFAEMGIILLLHDHPGHGRSDGFHCVIDDFDVDIVQNAIRVFDFMIKKHIQSHIVYAQTIDKPKNYFLLGASMGGAAVIKIALALQHEAANRYRGVILAAPMVGMEERHVPPQWQIQLGKYMKKWCCPYLKLIPNTLHQSLTNDKALQARLDGNPLKFSESLSLITADNLYETTMDITRRQSQLQLPTFICHGDADKATDYHQSVRFFENIGCRIKDKSLKIYKRGHLLFEEEPKIFADIVEWVVQQIDTQTCEII